jgi:signal transduction histidine kinase
MGKMKLYAEAVASMSRQFEAKVRELSTIRRIGDALAHTLEMERVCALILEAVMEGMGGEAGVLILFESHNRVPMLEVVSPMGLQGDNRLYHPTDAMMTWVLRERKTLLLQHVPEQSRSFGVKASLGGSLMTLPLISRELDMGVINLWHPETERFRPEQIPASQITAAQATIALENVKLVHELITMNESLERKVLERTRKLQETNQKLVELQNQLIQAETMKVIGQFTAGIGHNLRTPLSVILSTTDLIKLRGDGDGRIAAYVEKISQQSTRMAQIIQMLMEKCNKTQRRELERLNMNDILKKELSFLEGNLDFKHKVVKEYDFAHDLPEIDGFYGDFSQTFVNLINNAVDAMHECENPQLQIRTRFDHDHIYVDVEDNGCGIPEDDREKIFDFSFTTKAPIHRGGGPSGIGIGLFNSKHLMGKYGAEIQVMSCPGRTVFTLQIPRHMQKPCAEGPQRGERNAG